MTRTMRWLAAAALLCAVLGVLAASASRPPASASNDRAPDEVDPDRAPAIAASPPATRPLGAITLRCVGRGCDDQVSWRVQNGVIAGTGAEVTWRAPSRPGPCKVEVETAAGERVQVMLEVRVVAGVPLQERVADRGEVSAERAAEIGDLYAKLAQAEADGTSGRLARRAHQLELGPRLLEQQRYEEALVVYHDLILQFPRTSTASLGHRRGYGMAAFFLGRDAEAIQALTDAGGENDHVSFYYLGQLLERAGRKADAVEAYRAAGRRKPRFADPWLRAALLALELGERERAADVLIEAGPGVGREQIVELVGSDPELAVLLALIAELGPERLAQRGPVIVDTSIPDSASLGVTRQ